jgi:uncharacterized membrane protein
MHSKAVSRENNMAGIIYFPYHLSILILFIILIVFVLGLLYVGLLGLAFRKLGLPTYLIFTLLISAFVFSSINIPVFKMKTRRIAITSEYISFFGIKYRVPVVREVEDDMVVAINVGGALIPVAFSIFLILKLPFLINDYLIGILVVSIATFLMAKPVKGIGIVTPALLPPIVAAITALLISPSYSSFIAYVSGTLGTLIGADLLNIPRFKDLGASIVSIGGAGTFDGIFLTGIIAVLLA